MQKCLACVIVITSVSMCVLFTDEASTTGEAPSEPVKIKLTFRKFIFDPHKQMFQ